MKTEEERKFEFRMTVAACAIMILLLLAVDACVVAIKGWAWRALG